MAIISPFFIIFAVFYTRGVTAWHH